jgi:hypothetical protein
MVLALPQIIVAVPMDNLVEINVNFRFVSLNSPMIQQFAMEMEDAQDQTLVFAILDTQELNVIFQFVMVSHPHKSTQFVVEMELVCPKILVRATLDI